MLAACCALVTLSSSLAVLMPTSASAAVVTDPVDALTGDAAVEQIAEALAEVLLDLASFGELIEIPHANAQTKGLVPFAYETWRPEQRLFEATRTGRDLVVKPRQIGFSTLELARDVQYALTHSGVQVLIVVHDQTEKAKLFGRAKRMADGLARQGIVPKTKYSTKTEIVFAHNDSAIYVTEAGSTEIAAAKRGRSGTIHRLHATEVSFWGSPEATWGALMGACEHGDEIVMESTANGVGNFFHRCVLAAQAGQFAGFKLHFFPWFSFKGRTDDPAVYRAPDTKRGVEWATAHRKLRVTAKQMAWWWKKVEELRSLDLALQEYPPSLPAAFRAAGETWIETEALDALGTHARPPKFIKLFQHNGKTLGALRVYEEPRPSHDYVIGADVAEGVGKDRSALTVVHHRTAAVVASFHSETIGSGDFGWMLALVGQYYNGAWLAPERENDGKTTLSVLRRETGYSRIYVEPGGKDGWSTNGNTRPILWDDLRRAIQSGVATTPDAETIAEACSVTLDKSGRPAARGKGTDGRAKDDLFVSWAIARQVRGSLPLSTSTPIVPVGKPMISSRFRT